MDKYTNFLPFISMIVGSDKSEKGFSKLIVRLLEMAILGGLIAFSMNTKIESIQSQVHELRQQVEKMDNRIYELTK